jgi:hypothetical protein
MEYLIIFHSFRKKLWSIKRDPLLYVLLLDLLPGGENLTSTFSTGWSNTSLRAF